METLDKIAKSSVDIEKHRIEAFLTTHKENQLEREKDHEENRKLELELFKLQ